MALKSRSKRAAQEPVEDGALAKRFERKVRLSWFALLAERIWEALLWPFVVVAAFLVVSLLDLWSYTPPLLHRILLLAFGLALIVSFAPLLRLTRPTRVEALRRLEKDAGVKHRPASSYEDKLGATPPRETQQLWAAHRQRLARLIDKLRPAWPKPRTDRNDPYAFRAALVLGLAAAILATGGNGLDRLRQAFSPAATGAPSLVRLDAWVTPPVYTGIAPIVLADGNETIGAGAETFRALSVPERSELIVRAHAPQGESITLSTSDAEGTNVKTIAPKAAKTEGLVEFQVALGEPGSADVRIGGHTVAKWRFDLIKDEAPAISLLGAPSATPRAALRLVYRANDDHGVAGAEARFALAAEDGKPQAEPSAPSPARQVGKDGEKGKSAVDKLAEPPAMPLQLPRLNAKKVEGRATQDLTAHPWAGLKVIMTLAARDQAGQVGLSEPYEFVLPERQFTKPLARAVIEQRKKLVSNPEAVDPVVRALDALTIGGEKVFEDSFVYLALRIAYWRLRSDPSRETVASTTEHLWLTALRIEDGELPDAEREMRTAQDALAKALQENASSEEIKQLVEELRAALSRYLQALAAQANEKGNTSPQQPQSGEELVSHQDLDKMLKNIQELAESGSKELAERMLSELKDILDRIQTGNFAENAQQQRAGKMMKDLGEVINEQQKLLDETFNAKRQQSGEEAGSQAFEVSPPGQPMEFGPGMDLSQFFDLPGEPEQGGIKGQGQSRQQGAPQKPQLERGGQPQKGEQGQRQQGQHGQLAERQEQLRQRLQSMIDRLQMEGAEPAEEMEGAGEAMGEAKEAIGEDQLDRATQAQSLALDRLRKGAQSMAEQMMMSESGDMQPGQGPGANGRDPLGRPDRSNRPDLGLSVKVPDQIDIQRAREVLDELRRRLGDPSRPTFELDYLERLIRSF